MGRAHLREHCDNSLRARRTGFYHGSELPVYLAPALLALPRPDAAGVVLCTLEPRACQTVHKKHNTRRYEHPSPAVLALSGWGYTDFHASANFAFWGFSEVALLIYGVLRSCFRYPKPSQLAPFINSRRG